VRVAIYSPEGGIAELDAAVARTPAERARGFAGRPSIGANEAIFFAFPHDTTIPFTMAETNFPLDIIFIDRLGRIVGVARGEPRDSRPIYATTSRRAFRYVLELPAGWLAGRGFERLASVGWQPQALGVVV